MKKPITLLLSLFLFALLSVSCERETVGTQDKSVKVHISFSDFTFSYDGAASSSPASRISPSDAGMNRIALSVFASDNSLAFSTTKDASVDTEDFDNITCSLLPGDYSFVAVIHKATAADESAATITSTTAATLTTSKILKVFSATQAVTILANPTNNVVINLGRSITSQFQLKTTDPMPSNVVSCEIILSPTSSTTSAYVFNPATGFAANSYQYQVVFKLSELGKTTFQNLPLAVNCFITSNPENLTITVNMRDASDDIVMSRTFTDVPMAPHRVTRATGSFFTSTTGSSFTLDTSDDTMLDIPF